MLMRDMISYDDALLTFKSFEFVDLETRVGLLASMFYMDPYEVFLDLAPDVSMEGWEG